jgi:tetratricopeptide (TPR) repeat protein
VNAGAEGPEKSDIGERRMNRNCRILVSALAVALIALGICGTASAQSPQGGQSQTPAQQSDKSKTDVTPLAIPAAPANAEEDASYAAFQAVPTSELTKKIQAGEEFLKKYPDSRYKPPILGSLTAAYLQSGDLQKMREYGEKEVALQPNDVSTLAILGQAMSRGARGADAAQMLAKAEQYSKQAIEITPTLPKPEGMTDEAFTGAKNQTLSMAHSGLGLCYLKHGKAADAISELEQSLKLDPNPTPDPVNYYLLGISNKNESHFDDAVAAFTKCAALPGQLQPVCKGQAEDTKKQALTQLSAPK